MDIASVEKGHRFPPVAFALDEAAVRGYLEAVEDAALPALCEDEGQAWAPPMAVAALALPHEQILYVGDWPMPDILGARRAGVPVVWLNRHGHTLPPDMPTPDLEVASLTELLPILVG